MFAVSELACKRHNRILFTNLNFSLAAGDIIHIVGPNGCGKSSLLQILAGLLSAQAGSITWQGQVIHPSNNENYQREVNYVGHKLGIKDRLTVYENLMLACSLMAIDTTHATQDLLQRFELNTLKHKLCQYLSAGQKQRVALVRLLLGKAKLWLLDEPLVALDNANVEKLKLLIVEHLDQKGIVIFTSHQPLELPSKIVRQLALSEQRVA